MRRSLRVFALVHAWRPRSTPFPVRTVYFSGAALTEGAETHKIDGVPVRIYSPAKTVADCFKYRNKIGAEIAVEALKDYLKHASARRRCAVAFREGLPRVERDATLSGNGGLRSKGTRDRQLIHVFKQATAVECRAEEYQFVLPALGITLADFC